MKFINNKFEGSNIRIMYDEEVNEYFFSIYDIIIAITGSEKPTLFWRQLKRDLIDGGIHFKRIPLEDKKGIFRKTPVVSSAMLVPMMDYFDCPAVDLFVDWIENGMHIDDIDKNTPAVIDTEFGDSDLTIAVDKDNRTIWGTQKTISEAFGVVQSTISEHIVNLTNLGEINNSDHVSEIPIYDEKNNRNYKTKFYNLDAILKIGFKVNSEEAIKFRDWAAKIIAERFNEEINPDLIVDRAVKTYRRKGYSEEWIAKRIQGKTYRNQLTEEWKRCGALRSEYSGAHLTNELTKAWTGMTTKEYKNLKNLPANQELRDNMTDTELQFNSLAESTNLKLSKREDPKGYYESKVVTIKSGNAVKRAKEAYEEALGEKIVNSNSTLLEDKGD